MIINWLKTHKVSVILLIIILFILLRNGNSINPIPLNYSLSQRSLENTSMKYAAPQMIGQGSGSVSDMALPPVDNIAPSTSTNRLVIQNSDLSLLVKDVRKSNDEIINYAKDVGGFMVSSYLSNPQDTASATVVVRVPSRKLKDTLVYLRGLSAKVISENLNGEDVTDQYTDINARLQTLYTTKAKFEEIFIKAILIQDILNVQREIISIQDQIDSLKGQQQYLEKTSQLAKITVYLATDELELPYTPKETWRPEVIFKAAVRSLVQNLRDVATLIIWILVYSPIWLTILILGILIKKKFFRKIVQTN